MIPARSWRVLMPALLALAACQGHGRADDPAAVTDGEQARLNDAAASLDADAAATNADDDAADNDTDNTTGNTS